MVLENYQAFLKTSVALITSPETMPSYVLDGVSKDEAYKGSVLEGDEEGIKRFETARSERLYAQFKLGMQTAHVFCVDKVTKRMLLLTEVPKKNVLKQLRLPFRSMFFDVEISTAELPEGTAMDCDVIRGLLVMQMQNEVYCIATCCKADNVYINDIIFPLNDVRLTYGKGDFHKVVRQFLINVLMLMQHPDVELREFKRSVKNAERRVKRGDMPLPDHSVVVLKGKILRYVDAHRESLEGPGFDHRFWIRGHWRTHRAERYKTMRGRIIWIEPYLKGKMGEVRQRTYAVRPTKDEERQCREGFLWMDDIQPLDRPLSQMTDRQKWRAQKS